MPSLSRQWVSTLDNHFSLSVSRSLRVSFLVPESLMQRQTTLVVTGVLIGLTLGLGAYTFVYAKGYSYLTNNPLHA